MEQKNNTTIFASFCHKSSDFVDSLAKKLPHSVTLLRYENEVGNWESFTKFMDSISTQDFAVLVISDDYLKSQACMYEVLKLTSGKEWRGKAMFAIMPDAKIYSPEDRVKYVQFWAERYNKLKQSVLGLPEGTMKSFQKDLSELETIQNSIGNFLSVVSDSNNPPIYSVLDAICERVNVSLKTRFKMPLHEGTNISMKCWVILENIRQQPMSIREISSNTGLSCAAVKYSLTWLVNEGLVAINPVFETVGNQKRKINLYSA